MTNDVVKEKTHERITFVMTTHGHIVNHSFHPTENWGFMIIDQLIWQMTSLKRNHMNESLNLWWRHMVILNIFIPPEWTMNKLALLWNDYLYNFNKFPKVVKENSFCTNHTLWWRHFDLLRIFISFMNRLTYLFFVLITLCLCPSLFVH